MELLLRFRNHMAVIENWNKYLLPNDVVAVSSTDDLSNGFSFSAG